MKTQSANQQSAVVEVDYKELVALSNALNETFNALEAWEFPIRMGVELDATKKLHQEIMLLIDEIEAQKLNEPSSK